jgi:Domain of unknown function (DUF362)/Viral BACON domain
VNVGRNSQKRTLSRRDFLGRVSRGTVASALLPLALRRPSEAAVLNDIYLVGGIPDQPFYDDQRPNDHIGLDSLLALMGSRGLKFHRSAHVSATSGPDGLIGSEDVVLIKVNAQWKYRGCTNSDLVRGLIQRLLDHPDVFTGEVVIIENGQGRGSLACDTSSAYADSLVHANANDEAHSFVYLVRNIFKDPRVSTYLLDDIRSRFIAADEHVRDGYRTFENVSYPCFTTAAGRRVELREGVWTAGGHRPNLKLINVPVPKHHDTGGSEITACLKLFYGIVSMNDGQSGFRHYAGLGETCGKTMAAVCAPVLNIVDATWVSHGSITGYPPETTRRLNKLAASCDPVALDFWTAKYLLYPVDNNPRHHPEHPAIDRWLTQAAETINARGGLRDHTGRVVCSRVTKREDEIQLHTGRAGENLRRATIALSATNLRFLVSAGRSDPGTRTVEITNSGRGDLSWTAEVDADWLRCVPASGEGSGRLSVSVAPAGLEPGTYRGVVRIVSPQAANSPGLVRVVLSITDRRPGGKDRGLGKSGPDA